MDTALRWLVRDEEALPAGLDWLAPGEAARAASMRFPRRRTGFLLRRYVAKQAVAALLGRDTLARIEVRNAESGAPYVMVDGAPSGVGVSISDRAGRAVCLVSAGVEPLGCDLELVEPRSDGFVRDFFTAAERRFVAALPAGDARDAAANLIWSAKESALKVLRTGLRRDTRGVEVTLDPGAGGWAGLRVRTAEGAVFPGWWRRDGRFVFTVTTRAPAPLPVALGDNFGEVAASRAA